jgi:ubiquinone/menaquinone biosynthesis C-methylase UbiE
MRKSRKDYRALIRSHYREQALTEGLGPTSSMKDLITRRAELAEVISYLKDGDSCLEVGCGNGFASIEIGKAKNVLMTCIDSSHDLIELARKRSKQGVRGRIDFMEQDILRFESVKKYDVVFTIRCVINILDWSDQREALRRMAQVIRKHGRLILLEAYKDGKEQLNRAREEIGLPAIPPAYHNLHLDKQKVVRHLTANGLVLQQENNFLSSYYFGSRVLYPALAKIANRDVIYNGAFTKFFAGLPPIGNYSHIKILAFTKK